jgi:hypothetical protein
MHTDEQYEPSRDTPETPDSGGAWERFGALLSAAAARLRDALGADSLSVPADGDADRPDGRPDRSGAESAAPLPDDAAETATDPGELTVSRADGRLRVSEGDGAYIESDTWEEVER